MTETPTKATARRSARGYDRLAPVYEGLETLVFGDALQRARLALLGELPPLGDVLVLGEGDGRFVQALLLSQPGCRVTCVEQSPRMVERARRRLQRTGGLEQVTFVIRDALSFTPQAGGYDAVVTAFFLDCFTERVLERLVPTLLSGLRPQGIWYYADFRRPRHPLARLRADAYLALMHRFFRWQTGLLPRRLADPQPVFVANGLHVGLERRGNHGLLVTRIYHPGETSQDDL